MTLKPNAIERLQRATNVFARVAKFNLVRQDGVYDEDTWRAVQFVAKFLYALRQEGRKVAEDEATSQFLLALGTSSWPSETRTRAEQIAITFEKAALDLGLVVPGSEIGLGTIALYAVVFFGGLWVLDRYVLKG